MSVRLVASVAFAAALLSFAPASVAAGLSGTNWSLSTNEKLSVPKFKAFKSNYGGLAFSVDAGGADYTLTDPQAGSLAGTIATSKNGRKFKLTPDQNTLTTYETYLIGQIKAGTGASSVNVNKFTVKVSGTIDKTGALITIQRKATLRGSAVRGGRTFHGTITERGTAKGTKI